MVPESLMRVLLYLTTGFSLTVIFGMIVLWGCVEMAVINIRRKAKKRHEQPPRLV